MVVRLGIAEKNVTSQDSVDITTWDICDRATMGKCGHLRPLKVKNLIFYSGVGLLVQGQNKTILIQDAISLSPLVWFLFCYQLTFSRSTSLTLR